jgi:hypothetical protein
MTSAKSKARGAKPKVAGRSFVAIHQDELMLALARGFVAEPSQAHARTSVEVVKAAMGESTWGNVFLLEVNPAHKELAAGKPLLLADVLTAWAPSEDALDDVQARLETFDDTVSEAIGFKSDASLFPGEAEQAPLLVDANKAVPPAGGRRKQRDVVLEKTAGALVMARAQASHADWTLAELAELLYQKHRGKASGSIVAFTENAYRLVRPKHAESEDERIFVAAAEGLERMLPADGLDTLAFVEGLTTASGNSSAEAAAFLDTLKKILDNRIELSDSKVDDAGGVGQRALLVFLLAPKPEQLVRWLGARPVGRGVSMLASILSGLYCGLGGISRDAKGPGREAFLGAVAAAKAVVDESSAEIEVVAGWDESGNRVERLMASGFEFAKRVVPASGEVSGLLQTLRGRGLTVGVDSHTGVVRVPLGPNGVFASVTFQLAVFRFFATKVLQIAVSGRQAKKGAFTREFLEALLQSALHPIMPSIDATSGTVVLRLEVDRRDDLAEGLALMAKAVESLGLQPVGDRGLKAVAKKGANRVKKASAKVMEVRDGKE